MTRSRFPGAAWAFCPAFVKREVSFEILVAYPSLLEKPCYIYAKDQGCNGQYQAQITRKGCLTSLLQRQRPAHCFSAGSDAAIRLSKVSIFAETQEWPTAIMQMCSDPCGVVEEFTPPGSEHICMMNPDCHEFPQK